jgi:hypothetical protein
MNLSRGPALVGLLLVLGGLALLAQNFGLFGPVTGVVWVVMFGLGSLAFFAAFATNRGAWWFLIPAFVLAGLVGTILASEYFRQDELGGSIFLWAIGLAFWAVYVVAPQNWWAIIPAGVNTTLGLIPVAASRVEGTAIGAILFVGLGLTFGLLFLLRGRHSGQTNWAIFPAIACLGLALVLGVLGPLQNFWPVFLIAGGGYLLYLALRPRRASGGSADSRA